jgi:hypothetical protein
VICGECKHWSREVTIPRELVLTDEDISLGECAMTGAQRQSTFTGCPFVKKQEAKEKKVSLQEVEAFLQDLMEKPDAPDVPMDLADNALATGMALVDTLLDSEQYNMSVAVLNLTIKAMQKPQSRDDRLDKAMLFLNFLGDMLGDDTNTVRVSFTMR